MTQSYLLQNQALPSFRLLNRCSSRVLTEVRSQIYDHLQRLSLGFHYQAQNEDLIIRFTTDIGQMRAVTVAAV